MIHVKRNGSDHKIGIITLPSFYNGTAKDVKKQLVKLKKDDVDGVILDLRNNGGGALGEAMQLIGLFMGSAPGVQIKDAKGNVQVLGDRNNGAVYDGPLAVLTNRLSASASEIVAGALQDYGRAVILGSQTFGKGTVQTLLPLSEGQLKLTEAKFYRVTGESTQDRGVTPDIKFPQRSIRTRSANPPCLTPCPRIVFRRPPIPIRTRSSTCCQRSRGHQQRVAETRTSSTWSSGSSWRVNRASRRPFR